MLDLLLHYLAIRKLTFKKKKLILIDRKISSSYDYKEIVALCKLYDQIKNQD